MSRSINTKAQKIDCLLFKTSGIALVRFPLLNRMERIWFFKKKFLLVDTRYESVPRNVFLNSSNASF